MHACTPAKQIWGKDILLSYHCLRFVLWQKHAVMLIRTTTMMIMASPTEAPTAPPIIAERLLSAITMSACIA